MKTLVHNRLFIVLLVLAAIIAIGVLAVGIRDMEFREPDPFYYELPMALMVGGFLFAFIAWDLMEFKSRINQGSEEDQFNSLTLNHFVRLGLVLALGFGVVALTRFIRLRFNFEIAALLTLAGVWGLSLLVGRLRRGE